MEIFELMTVAECMAAVAVAAFVLLVIFLIITLVKLKKSVEAAQHDFHRVSLELSRFLAKTTQLSSDIQEKSERLVGTLSSFLETQSVTSDEQPPSKTNMPLKAIGWVVSSWFLARKAKNFIKGMVK